MTEPHELTVAEIVAKRDRLLLFALLKHADSPALRKDVEEVIFACQLGFAPTDPRWLEESVLSARRQAERWFDETIIGAPSKPG